MTTFTISGKLVGMNEIIGAARTHWAKSAKQKKQTQDQIIWELRQQRVKPITDYPVTLSFAWYEQNRRRDPDNFTAGGRKVILDALQEAGIMRNDGWDEVAGWADEWKVDKERPRVEVTISTLENQHD